MIRHTSQPPSTFLKYRVVVRTKLFHFLSYPDNNQVYIFFFFFFFFLNALIVES